MRALESFGLRDAGREVRHLGSGEERRGYRAWVVLRRLVAVRGVVQAEGSSGRGLEQRWEQARRRGAGRAMTHAGWPRLRCGSE